MTRPLHTKHRKESSSSQPMLTPLCPMHWPAGNGPDLKQPGLNSAVKNHCTTAQPFRSTVTRTRQAFREPMQATRETLLYTCYFACTDIHKNRVNRLEKEMWPLWGVLICGISGYKRKPKHPGSLFECFLFELGRCMGNGGLPSDANLSRQVSRFCSSRTLEQFPPTVNAARTLLP